MPYRVCVFCGAAEGARPRYRAIADDLGRRLARENTGVVYGAGGAGVMGALADAVLDEGGELIGVIPQDLMLRERGRTDLEDLRVVGSMHERKALMHELSNAYVVLPGGLGTLEEFFEVVTWAQLRLHDKRIVLLDVDNYYKPLVSLLDHAVAEGFMTDRDRRLVRIAQTVDEAIQLLSPDKHQTTGIASS